MPGSTAIQIIQGGGVFPKGGWDIVPGQGVFLAQILGYAEQQIAETAGVQVAEGIDDRLLHTHNLIAGAGFGKIIPPTLQIDPVGQNQVGH